MRALANGAGAADPSRALLDAVKTALGDLDQYSVTETIDDIELAELIGRLRALVGVLVSVVDD